MSVTIAEAKSFIKESEKCRDVFLTIAEDSWAEIKKRRNNEVIRDYRAQRRKRRYPSWWSIFKIRQPLVLSRPGVPIGKDTTEAGQDTIGATAALCLERLAKNLAKSFDFMDVLEDCRDDVLATSFTTARLYYERETRTEPVKEYVQIIQGDDGEPQFFDAEGAPVDPTELKADDDGMYLDREQVVEVEDEKVCLEPVLYNMLHVDPECRRWRRAKRWAFEEFYSVEEFKDLFGVQAYLAMSQGRAEAESEDKAKQKNRDTIKVYEYWDAYDKQCYWFTEHSPEFIKPRKYMTPEGEEDEQNANGLYNLAQFVPAVKPLVIGAPTDEFWPVPEYEQLCDLFEEIHTLFSRMMAVSRAIRAKLLYDKNIPGLSVALNSGRDADTFGVPNLANALAASGGKLDSAVQYVAIQPLVESLASLYTALEQRLDTIYRLTGTSDLLQGLQQDKQRDRTLGESQMLEKYAMNQLAELQRKMQEFVRDCYQLMAECALKNFKEETLDRHIIPRTLPPEHQRNYRAALGLLKDDTKRFRVELETDSTIAINEQYDKAVRMELVNTATAALEKVAGIAESAPMLVAIELRFLKHLIQGFRGAKMFQEEISTTLDNVIKQAEEAAQNAQPAFDAEQAKAQLEGQRLQVEIGKAQAEVQQRQSENSLKLFELQSKERIEGARMQQEQLLKGLDAQVAQFKTQMEIGKSQAELQLAYAELSAGIAKTREEIAVKQQQLIIELQKIAGEQDIEKYRVGLEEQFGALDAMLKQRQQAVEEQLGGLELAERIATEQRLQDEHQLGKAAEMVQMAATIKQAATPEPQAVAKEPKRKRAFKMKRDKNGNLVSVEAKDERG